MRALQRTSLSSYLRSYKHHKYSAVDLFFTHRAGEFRLKLPHVIICILLHYVIGGLWSSFAVNCVHRLGNMLDTWMDMTSDRASWITSLYYMTILMFLFMYVVWIALQKHPHNCLWAPPCVALIVDACPAACLQRRDKWLSVPVIVDETICSVFTGEHVLLCPAHCPFCASSCCG